MATVSAIALGAWLPSGASADPCVVVDNGTGTITLPPEGCEYLSPTEVHEIIDGLPAGTTIELAPIHKDFICSDRNDIFPACPPPGICEDPGGTTDCFDSALDLTLTGTGDLATFARSISVPLFCQIQTQPRNPGDPVQSFDTDMVSCQGGIFGDPDFDSLQIVAGSGNGLPSPGHTTLTDLGNGTFQVDSFFDIFYTIDYVGAPGGALNGASGSTTLTIHMEANGAPAACPLASSFCQSFAADCVGNAGDLCYPTSAKGTAAAGSLVDGCGCYNGIDCGPFDVITDPLSGAILAYTCLPANCPDPNELCQIYIDGNPTGQDVFDAINLQAGQTLTCNCPKPAPDPHITQQGTSATFGSLDVPAVPADFFEPGSDPFTGAVNLVGGPNDTLGQRSGSINCPGIGPCDPVSVELIALDLVSAAPITVSPGLSQWDVAVDLSPTGAPPLGTLSATLTHPNGGTYDADIPFSPRFTFTEVGNPGNVRVLDFDLEGLAPIQINFLGTDWVVQLGGLLVGTIDAPSDGNFVPGVRENVPGDPNSQKVIQALGLSKGGGIDHPVQQPPTAPPPHPDPHITVQGTSATFGSPDVPAVPADFFGPGSDPLVGTVNLVGGPTDTLGQRSGPIVCPGIGPCNPVSVELIALDLVSVAPMTVSFNSGNSTEAWDVGVALSPTGTPPLGTLNATLTHANGGTYDADIPFSPRFAFTKVSNPLDVRVLDFDLDGLPPIQINFLGTDWVIQLGAPLVGTVNAPNDGNFVAGVREVIPGDPNSQVVIQALGLSKGGGIDHPIQLPTYCSLPDDGTGVPPLCAALQTSQCVGSPNDLCLPKVVQTNDSAGVEAVECACHVPGPFCGPVAVDVFNGFVSCPGDCVTPDSPPCQLYIVNPDGTSTATGLTQAHPIQFPSGTQLTCDCAPPCVDDTDCDDGIKCTSDVCLADGSCAHTAIPGCCATDADCPSKCEFCDPTTNTCFSIANCCVSDADCDDGNDCTADVCDPATNSCSNTRECFADRDCNDGNSCTTDTCDRVNGCCIYTPDCTVDTECDDGIKCTKDTCNPVTSCCVSAPIAGCCASDADCPPDPKCHDSFCDLATNLCRVSGPFPGCCVTDADCPNKCEVCDPATNQCVQVDPNCCASDADCPSDGNPCTNELCDPATNLCVSQPIAGCVCQPNDPKTACVGECADATVQCRAKCVNYDPGTGVSSITACGCDAQGGSCSVGVAPGVAPRGPGANPCIVTDNGTGTVTLPPAGCEYLSAQEVHEIVDGLPAGTTIELAPIHKNFICDKGGQFPGCPPPGLGCEIPGSSLGGDTDCFLSTLELQVTGNGPALPGFSRTLFPNLQCQIETGPRVLGDAVQDFDTEMVFCQGELFGDPDFCTFKVTAGSGFGLPSPGHTTLTDVGGGNWQVDSFFDIAYRIDFAGCPGSILEGMSGTTQRTIRMSTGDIEPDCEGVCGVDEDCVKTRTQLPDGTVDICCDCVERTGACCVPGALCQMTTASTCAALGGAYAGDDTNCDDNDGNGIPDECEPDICVPTDDGSGCVGPCPTGGCFGECINGAYCDDPACCLDPDACQCYLPNTKESIKRCGDCFGECINGAYCDGPDPACCINPGGCACYAQNSEISIQLCQDNPCFGFCEGGSYCDGPDPTCAIQFGAPACYLPEDPISIKLCQDPTTPPVDDCQPRCVTVDPLTGVTKVVACDCAGKGECHVDLPAAAGGGGVSARGTGGDPCIVPDDAGGTVTLPPIGCDYLSPEEVHAIFDAAGSGVTFELAPIHKDFICSERADGIPGCPPPNVCEEPGGGLGGNVDCFDSVLQLSVSSPELPTFARTLFVPALVRVDTGPRNPGDAVQDFETEMVQLQGELFGDPDFCTLRITAGGASGLPSPGHTTLTRLGPPGSSFAVDSFFDLTYRIVFQGCPGSALEGMNGSTTGTLRMKTGNTKVDCVGACGVGDICVETRTVDAAGIVTVCCDCQPDAVCEPTDDRTACKPFDCPDPNDNCQPTLIEVVGVCGATGVACKTDADCPPPDTCLTHEEVVECNCVPKDVPPTCHWQDGPVAGEHICVGVCDDGVTACHVTTVVNSDGTVDYKCGCDEPSECKPNATGTACEPFVCPGPLPPLDSCVASCVVVDPLTGAVTITDCDCRGLNECRAQVGATPGGTLAGGVDMRGAGTPGSPCVLPENPSGTVTLPPAGCEYLSPDEVHEILDGLPTGVTIEFAAIHKDFVCDRQPGVDPGFCPPGLPDPVFGCEQEGGDLGGNVECGSSGLELTVLVNGASAGRAQPHFMTLSGVKHLFHSGPHGGGADVQSFDTEMVALQGEALPDSLFSLFRVRAGRQFGLPSPGHTTLTRMPSGDFSVDSFFDVVYEIDFIGAPGSVLDGAAGTTTGTLRMKTGSVPQCEGACPDSTFDQCVETVTVNADGTISKCCDCGCPPSSAPRPVPILDLSGASHDLTSNRNLIFQAGDAGRNQAIRVTLVDLARPFDIWNGQQLFVGQPGIVSSAGADVVWDPNGPFGNFVAAQLQCEPVCRDDWSTLGDLHAFHEGIVPGSAYRIEVVDCSCDLADKNNYSPAFSQSTSVLGDTLETISIVPPGPPDTLRNIDDVLGVIASFASAPTAPRKARSDIEPNCLDQVINITDALLTLRGFTGGNYNEVFLPKVTDLCLSPCGNPIPDSELIP